MWDAPFCAQRVLSLLYRNSLRYNYNVGSLRSAITLGYIESNGLAFLQSLEAISYDAGEMYEYILASLRIGDEAISLCSVEPLNSTFAHDVTSKNIKDVFCRSLSATELRIA